MSCKHNMTTDLISDSLTLLTHTGLTYIMSNAWTILWVIIPLLMIMKKQKTWSGKGQRQEEPLVSLKLAVTLSLVVLQSWRKSHDTDTLESTYGHQGDFDLPILGLGNPLSAYTLVIFLTILGEFGLLKFIKTKPALLIFLIWCGILSFQMMSFYQKHADERQFCSEGIHCWIDILLLLGGVFQCFVFLFTFTTPGDGGPSPMSRVHPQSSASWWSDCILHWALDLALIGSKRNLEESDVYDLMEKDQCLKISSKLERLRKIDEFKRQLTNEATRLDAKGHAQDGSDKLVDGGTKTKHLVVAKEKEIPVRLSLLRILIQAFGFKFFLFQFFKGVWQITFVVSPVLMSYFINHIQNRDNESWLRGVGIAIGTFAIHCVVDIFYERIYVNVCTIQNRIRSSIMLCVFKKALRMKNEYTKDLTRGEIVNLIGSDCDTVTEMCQLLFHVMSTPLMVSVSMYLAYKQMGSAMFVGLLIMLLLIPLNRYIGIKIHATSKKVNEERQKRFKLMNEIINGIMVIKLYAWEPSFIKKIHDIRRNEERYYNTISVLETVSSCLSHFIPILVKCGAYAIFLIYGGQIDAVHGFVTMRLFRLLNEPFITISNVIPGYVEAILAFKRINTFLNGEDIPEDIIVNMRKSKWAISIDNGMFSFDSNCGKPTLKDINVNIPKGGLVAVVGSVGCGKSSFLSAILGEMEKIQGDVEVQGQISYVPQEAWILNATLRDNILFHSKFDDSRYQHIVNACALRTDFNILPVGDQTVIGENGINLSGGQKQRVSLARALYNNADVYLLDDPLSAVDAHVGKHIFNQVIGHKGLLGGKTRVLVTHGIHWLPFVDSILVLKDGVISESGTYKELTSHEGDFAQFLRDVLAKNTDELTPSDTDLKQQYILKRLSSIPENKQSVNREKVGNFREIDSESDESIEPDKDSADDEHIELLEDTCSVGEMNRKVNIIEEEELEKEQFKKEIYLKYVKEIGVRSLLLILLLLCSYTLFDSMKSNIIKEWTEDSVLVNKTLSGSDEVLRTNWQYFILFAIAGIVEVVSLFLFSVVMIKGTFKAANRMHNNMLYTILRCPMSFFDTTPFSRIINRFCKDVPRIDYLGRFAKRLTSQIFRACTYLLMIFIFNPMSIVYFFPIAISCCIVFRLHIGSLRQIRRYKTKHRSPMYSHFTETLNGLASVRAYQAQENVITTMGEKIDQFNKFELGALFINLGLSLRLSLLYRVIELIALLVCVVDTRMSPGRAGLLITYVSEFAGTLLSVLRNIVVIETDIVSLERVISYSNKPSEAEWEIRDKKTSIEWPANGTVVFENYKAKYRDGLDLVLKGIDCRIESGEKVGIVGRTGAGKTSLTNAIFRLFEAADGRISIDDEIIGEIGLHDLRSKVNILPQDPVIFNGTLRMNLDPMGKSTDDDIWKALHHSHIANFVEGLNDKLDFKCEEGGNNMSVGQRQLICLARVLLRKTNILVLDEATAAVDMDTDDLIQRTIRTEFKECTVLTIAHRLNTIMDYDKILVLDQGLIKEFDSPSNLLNDENSAFHNMVNDAKIVDC